MIGSLGARCVIAVEWASNGFGALGRAYETALAVTALGSGSR